MGVFLPEQLDELAKDNPDFAVRLAEARREALSRPNPEEIVHSPAYFRRWHLSGLVMGCKSLLNSYLKASEYFR